MAPHTATGIENLVPIVLVRNQGADGPDLRGVLEARGKMLQGVGSQFQVVSEHEDGIGIALEQDAYHGVEPHAGTAVLPDLNDLDRRVGLAYELRGAIAGGVLDHDDEVGRAGLGEQGVESRVDPGQVSVVKYSCPDPHAGHLRRRGSMAGIPGLPYGDAVMNPNTRQVPLDEMSLVILAGGKGLRLREETERIPKPLVGIGEYPMLWHIMKLYRHYGFRHFIVCLGYKGWEIKEYFLRYREHVGDFTLGGGDDERPHFHDDTPEENWEITLRRPASRLPREPG